MDLLVRCGQSKIVNYIADQQLSSEALSDDATVAQIEKATGASKAEILGVANLSPVELSAAVKQAGQMSQRVDVAARGTGLSAAMRLQHQSRVGLPQPDDKTLQKDMIINGWQVGEGDVFRNRETAENTAKMGALHNLIFGPASDAFWDAPHFDNARHFVQLTPEEASWMKAQYLASVERFGTDEMKKAAAEHGVGSFDLEMEMMGSGTVVSMTGQKMLQGLGDDNRLFDWMGSNHHEAVEVKAESFPTHLTIDDYEQFLPDIAQKHRTSDGSKFESLDEAMNRQRLIFQAKAVAQSFGRLEFDADSYQHTPEQMRAMRSGIEELLVTHFDPSLTKAFREMPPIEFREHFSAAMDGKVEFPAVLKITGLLNSLRDTDENLVERHNPHPK